MGGLGRYPGLRGQSWEGIRSKSGPNPSEKAFLGRGRNYNVSGPRTPERIFSIDILSFFFVRGLPGHWIDIRKV